MSIILKGGTIVLEDKEIKGDLKIEGEQIAQIAESIVAGTGDEIIDVSGKIVFPGVIDAHVHYKMPIDKVYSIDNFVTG